ncbi:MAG: beta-ketoacyl-ACP synthase III [Planctomycetota bacterium]|nr:beta-ketoacyl-ACP synthase III [Planctomycetota bacterium]
MRSKAEYGVQIAGVGSALPSRVLTNADLEKMVNTSDEWIVKRTGIHRRRICDPETEGEFTLARDALKNALDDAGMDGRDLDLIIHASTTSEMACPPNACRIAAALGATSAGAFDLLAACSGLVYGMNVADSVIRTGRYRTVGIIGCDALSTITDYTDRRLSILFGDAGGAMVLTRDDDPSRGCVHQSLGANGGKWDVLYLPRREQDIPEWDRDNPIRLGCLRMSGQEVFKFAVSKFREVITEGLKETGLSVDDISQFVCHQSNVRIIDAAKQKLGLPDEKVHINIGEYGNSSAASVGVVFDELWKAGKVKRGDHVVFVAFGGGLTWASSIWRI